MRELSLHILDIAMNSVKANASVIEINICEDTKENLLTIEIIDNGSGMSPEFLKTVRDPFSTTRTTRKVGMGISLFEAAAVACGGKLELSSELGKGTALKVYFEHNHIDRAPLGDMSGTIQTLISGSPDIDFIYRHSINGKEFLMDTAQLRRVLDGVPLDTPDVLSWISEFVSEGLSELSR